MDKGDTEILQLQIKVYRDLAMEFWQLYKDKVQDWEYTSFEDAVGTKFEELLPPGVD